MPLIIAEAPYDAPGSLRLSYIPAEAGATVTQVRLYTDPARTGTPVFTATPVDAAGAWTFSADLADGDYYSAFDVTDSTGSFTDGTDFFLVVEGQVERSLVSLAKVKRHLGLENDSRHDDELTDLLLAATRPIEEMVGPVLPREVVEVLTGNVLSFAPVLSVTSVDRYGVAVEPAGYVLNGASGLLDGTGGYLVGSTVTYVAGRETVNRSIQRAALRWIAWSWRRDHGGSESYMPGGDDAVPGMGPAGIERELRHILAADLRGMRVA